MESLWFHPEDGQEAATDTATSAPLSRNLDEVKETILLDENEGKI